MLKNTLTVLCCILFLSGCSTRQILDSHTGSTSQRLVSHSIDDLIRALDKEHLGDLQGQDIYVQTHFLENNELKQYADSRLQLELTGRFKANIAPTADKADQIMTVFYTSLATDLDNFGLTIPVGYIPGFESFSQLNVIALEKFHGISEMYYYIGPTGTENRSQVMQRSVKTDALGLPFITIPLSTVDRHESELIGLE